MMFKIAISANKNWLAIRVELYRLYIEFDTWGFRPYFRATWVPTHGYKNGQWVKL